MFDAEDLRAMIHEQRGWRRPAAYFPDLGGTRVLHHRGRRVIAILPAVAYVPPRWAGYFLSTAAVAWARGARDGSRGRLSVLFVFAPHPDGAPPVTIDFPTYWPRLSQAFRMPWPCGDYPGEVYRVSSNFVPVRSAP